MYPISFLAICFSLFSVYVNGQYFLPDSMINKLASMPLGCINKQWPNKTNHTSDTISDHVLLPDQLHPAFYGCLDWHSSVHGHWMLVKLLKEKPDVEWAENAKALLENSFQENKIRQEAAYFNAYSTSKTFERTYGWAWLLKLDLELSSMNTPQSKKWYKNLQPLTTTIITLWKNYLPRQTYANRTGVHPNTAFGLCFALDWARAFKDTAFEKMIIKNAKTFYLSNIQIPAWLEPDGTDFFSPSLQAADLMRRILPKQQFTRWLEKYFSQNGIDNLLKMPVVSDRSDYQIVHLDGLSLSRSWCLKNISRVLPAGHKWKSIFYRTSQMFLQQTLPKVVSGNYGGDHWLATFAVYALFDK